MAESDPDIATSARRSSFDTAIRTRIGERKFGMWFEDGARCDLRAGRLSVHARNDFVRDWIQRHFLNELVDAARDATGSAVEVEIVSSPDDFEGADARSAASGGARSQTPAAAESNRGPQMVGTRRRDARRAAAPRLHELAVNEGNALAVHAARVVASGVADAPTMTLIHGRCGTGKSHLLLAIEAERRRAGDGARIRYLTAERFTNDYLAALRLSTLESFRRDMRGVDLLLIDDLSFLANKNATLMEMLHTLDAVLHGGARVVITMSTHPSAERRFPAPMVSRLVAGVVAELPPPDAALRRKLAAAEAARRGIALSPDALHDIADHCLGGAREIKGVFTSLEALRSLDPTTDLNAAAAALRGAATLTPQRIDLNAIVDSAANLFGVSASEIRGTARRREVVDARGMVALLSREMTSLSLPEIARGLGRDAHSTVLQAADRMRRQCEGRVVLRCGAQALEAGEARDRLRIAIARPDRGPAVAGASRSG